jgi:hypothetical protein
MGLGFCDGFYGFSSEKIPLPAYREFLKKTLTTLTAHHALAEAKGNYEHQKLEPEARVKCLKIF